MATILGSTDTDTTGDEFVSVKLRKPVTYPDGSVQSWTEDGTELWYDNKGERHRRGGPAMVRQDGSSYWYRRDQLHRSDGPALCYSDESQYWYIRGRPISPPPRVAWRPLQRLLTYAMYAWECTMIPTHLCTLRHWLILKKTCYVVKRRARLEHKCAAAMKAYKDYCEEMDKLPRMGRVDDDYRR